MSENKFNVLILGNAAVGKTSIIKAYTTQAFDESHQVTLGLDYVSQRFKPIGSD